VERFVSSAGGAIARGRRRLRWLLGGLCGFLLAAAVGAFSVGRFGPGAIALLALAVPLFAWRTASDHETLWLALDDGGLEIRMRWRQRRLPLAGAVARRLSAEEIADLERLATLGGITAGSGGFESRRLGEFELYASDLRNAVLVEAGEERLVVTPDDAEAFLSSLRAPNVATSASPRATS
jgi:hypothetical protein